MDRLELGMGMNGWGSALNSKQGIGALFQLLQAGAILPKTSKASEPHPWIPFSDFWD